MGINKQGEVGGLEAEHPCGRELAVVGLHARDPGLDLELDEPTLLELLDLRRALLGRDAELCARIAELPNIVAIKYSVPRAMYAKLTKLVGDKIIDVAEATGNAADADIAPVVEFLIGPGGGFVSGATIPADGGRAML